MNAAYHETFCWAQGFNLHRIALQALQTILNRIADPSSDYRRAATTSKLITLYTIDKCLIGYYKKNPYLNFNQGLWADE
ncbi:hypothetical protein Slin15195_G123220 [Septoria linicola]|uniref:Uncharacterized protein n=1 Tax=Septoria linicola TaxID=215465 RepID=A0A9Q9B4W1_9PEZI|nr:hypothetical protein Slin14017_G079420 [Septoria linicola]USW59003.1 hypothetical protein Slin15195_G123220 [Septoria linicola]